MKNDKNLMTMKKNYIVKCWIEDKFGEELQTESFEFEAVNDDDAEKIAGAFFTPYYLTQQVKGIEAYYTFFEDAE